MMQGILENHVIELLHATVAEGKVTWPGPITLELVAEAETAWQPEESQLRRRHLEAHAALQELPLVIENRSRLAKLEQSSNDLQVLLTVSNSATLLLDRQLNIKRFTPKVRELLNILPTDKGQSLAYLSRRLGFDHLVGDAAQVLRTLIQIEREIHSERDKWYLARLLPYRTVDDQIDGVVITFLDITQLKETEARLLQSQQQIEWLTHKLDKVVVEQTERVRRLASEVLITEQKVQSRISQILHDDLQQTLVSIQRQVRMINDMLPAGENTLQEHIQGLREAADLAFDVTRLVAVDLQPPIFLHEDFMMSLIWLAEVMSQRHGLIVELKGRLRPGWPGQEVCILLFQTVRELLFNVVKHAGVKQATVEVSEGPDCQHLIIEVSDQGKGFDVADALASPLPDRGGLGLVSIRNRLELLGGRFDIESQPGKGTRATIVVLV